MGNQLTLNMLLDLPHDVLKISNKIDSYLDLLSDDICREYYYTDLKKDLIKYFNKFKDVKYKYKYCENFNLKSNSNYEVEGVFGNNIISDKVGNYVAKNIDLEIWTLDFYNNVVSIAHKLTYQEAIYFVDTFFANKTEEQISEKLSICRKTLQKIKKSCLVKILLEFDL